MEANASHKYVDKNLDENSYAQYRLYTSKEDDVEFDFAVKQGSFVDVYIMSSENFDRYKSDLSFVASFSNENVHSVDDKWEDPDDQSYYLVIDNRDNSHTNDAEPTGNITYDLEYDDSLVNDDILGYTTAIIVGCCIILVIIVIVFIWLIMKKDKPKSVVMPPPAPIFPPPMAPSPYQPPPPQPPPQPPQPPPGYKQVPPPY